MFEGYIEFGGVEVVNNERAIMRDQSSRAFWLAGNVRRYPGIRNVLAPVDLADPTTAPWYDPDVPDLSSRFLGVFALEVPRIYDSTRMVPVTQNSGDGGVLGNGRRSTRRMRVRAAMIALGRDAAEYGRSWLESVLSLDGCEQAQDCDQADVRFFADVPSDTDAARELSRFLRYAETVSGPLTVSESERWRGDGLDCNVYSYTVEWTWESERAHIYGADREVPLEIAPSQGYIQDAPINWAPYPSAELSDGPLVIAHNAATNPGLEVDASGWVGGAQAVTGADPSPYTSAGRVAEGVSAYGDYAFRTRLAGDGVTAVSGVADIGMQYTLPLAGIPAGHRLAASIWVAVAQLAGPPISPTLDVFLRFLDAGNAAVGTDEPMTPDGAGPGIYTAAAPVTVPVGATQCRVYVQLAGVDWSSDASDADNSDVRVYADAATIWHVEAS